MIAQSISMALLVAAATAQQVYTVTEWPSMCSAIYTSGTQSVTVVQSTVTVTTSPSATAFSDEAANNGTPFVLQIQQPTTYGRRARQAATEFWLMPNGNTTTNGSLAAQYQINSGRLSLVTGGYYSTSAGVANQPFASSSSLEVIDTTFVITGGVFSWNNDAFTPNGSAEFYKTPAAAVTNAEVIVSFTDDAGDTPADWAPLVLTALPVSSADGTGLGVVVTSSVITSIIMPETSSSGSSVSAPLFTYAPTTGSTSQTSGASSASDQSTASQLSSVAESLSVSGSVTFTFTASSSSSSSSSSTSGLSSTSQLSSAASSISPSGSVTFTTTASSSSSASGPTTTSQSSSTASSISTSGSDISTITTSSSSFTGIPSSLATLSTITAAGAPLGPVRQSQMLSDFDNSTATLTSSSAAMSMSSAVDSSSTESTSTSTLTSTTSMSSTTISTTTVSASAMASSEVSSSSLSVSSSIVQIGSSTTSSSSLLASSTTSSSNLAASPTTTSTSSTEISSSSSTQSSIVTSSTTSSSILPTSSSTTLSSSLPISSSTISSSSALTSSSTTLSSSSITTSSSSSSVITTSSTTLSSSSPTSSSTTSSSSLPSSSSSSTTSSSTISSITTTSSTSSPPTSSTTTSSSAPTTSSTISSSTITSSTISSSSLPSTSSTSSSIPTVSSTTVTSSTITTSSQSSSTSLAISSSSSSTSTTQTTTSTSAYLILISPTACAFGDPAGTDEDDAYCEIDLPFSLEMYSDSSAVTYASTNGYISLGNGSAVYQPNPLPFSALPNNTIAPLFDDLELWGAASPTQGIFYEANEAGVTYEYYIGRAHGETAINHFTVTYLTSQPGVFTYTYYNIGNGYNGNTSVVGSQGVDSAGVEVGTEFSYKSQVITPGSVIECDTTTNACTRTN